MMLTDLAVRRVDFGYFVRPAEETGTGAPRVEPCFGYLVSHPDGVVLVDTGMGSHPEVDAHYRPRRRPLDEALAAAGVWTTLVPVARWATRAPSGCPLGFTARVSAGEAPDETAATIRAQRPRRRYGTEWSHHQAPDS